MVLLALLALELLLFTTQPADAWFLVPIIAAALEVSTVVAGAIVLAGSVALSFGLNYVASKLMTPTPGVDPNVGGAQLDPKVAADVPMSLIVGRAVTGGSRVFTGTGGTIGETQNAILIEIMALADHPCQGLAGVFVAGLPAAMTDLAASVDPGRGANVTGWLGAIGTRTKANYLATFGLPAYGSGAKNGAQTTGESNPAAFFVDYEDRLHIRFYDGTQNNTAWDATAVGVTAGNSPSWPTTSYGKGITYVRLHSVYEQTKVPGPMDWKFVVDGIKLYDPRKDTTVGGSGAHRWGTASTYEWTDNVAVIVYNIVRGIYVNGVFFYGIEGTTAAQLPLDIWFAAMNECDVAIALDAGGTEPQFTAGGEISVDTEPLDAILALLKASAGRFVEIGGIYKLYIGAPGVSVLDIDDGSIRANQADTFNMVLPLEQRVNTVTGKYTSPGDGWVEKVAPPRSDATYITEDGRTLPGDLVAGMVQSDTQMQRLQMQMLLRARRERKHTLPLPPLAFVLEPGDVFTWNSVRNGYVTKTFEVDGVDYDPNLNVTVACTEVDHSDYDWSTALEFAVGSGQIIVLPPIPKTVVGFDAVPFTFIGDTGTARPGIKLTWDDPNDPDATSIHWQLRVTADPTNFTSGSSDGADAVAAGQLGIVGGLQPLTAYQVRARFGSSVGFASDWSLWIDVTTDDIRLTLADFEAFVTQSVSTEFQTANAAINAIEELISATVAEQDADNYKKLVDIQASVGELSGSVTVTAIAAAGFASYQVTTTASIGALSASVTTNQTAIATINGKLAATYQVTLDVIGYVSAIKAFNDGTTTSWTIIGDIFQVAFPGVTGGSPAYVFQISNVSGSPKVAIRADVIADGTITATKMVTGTITAVSGIIGTLAVQTLAIDDNAVTFPKVVSETTAYTGSSALPFVDTVQSISGHIASKAVTVFASMSASLGYSSGFKSWQADLHIVTPAGDVIVASASGNAVGEASVTLSGSVVYTPPNTTAFNVEAYLQWNPLTNSMQLNGRTMFLLVTKR